MASSALIKTTGGDYSTFAAFDAAALSTDNWTANISGTVTDSNINPNNAAFTTLVIQANPGEEHTGVIGTGARWVLTGAGYACSIDTPGTCTIQDLECDANANGSTRNIFLVTQTSLALVTIQRCIFHNFAVTSTTTSTGVIRNTSANRKLYVYSCIFHNLTSVINIPAIVANGGITSGELRIENNTVTDCATTGATASIQGIVPVADSGALIYNNLVTDIRIDGGGSGTASCYHSNLTSTTHAGNLSDDATGDLTNKSITFANAASSDYHLASGDTDALGAGSTSGNLPNDIDNETRDVSTPDIGADEFAGGIVIQAMYHYQHNTGLHL